MKMNTPHINKDELLITLEMIESKYPSSLVLSVLQMAELLQCSCEHIRRIIRTNKLKSQNLKRHVVLKYDFAKYLLEKNKWE